MGLGVKNTLKTDFIIQRWMNGFFKWNLNYVNVYNMLVIGCRICIFLMNELHIMFDM